MASGAGWMILFRMLERSLGLISTIILARILVPADFGLVAMATTVIALIEIFTMNDFGGAIIQNQSATRVDYDTAWTMEVLLGFGAGIGIALLAWPASKFFGDSRLVPVLLVLALYPLLDGLYNMGCVEFRKTLQFDKDFRLMITRKLSGFMICIPLAFMMHSYWAMIFGMLAGRFGALLASYLMHPFRPRWSLEAAGRIWGYSKWVMANNALTFLSVRSPHIIIGRLGDPRALGLYSVSSDFASLPTSELALPINRAVFPGYSTLQDDPQGLKRAFLSVFAVVALLVLPAGFGVAAIAPTLVPLVLGPKWLEAIRLVQILAVGGAIAALHANLESVYFAKGLTRVRAQITGLQVMIMIPAMLWCTWKYGLTGAAFAYLATSIAVASFNLWRACTLLKVRGSELFAVLWRPIGASAAMFVLVYEVDGHTVAAEGSARLTFNLIIEIATGAASYLSLVACLWWLAGRPSGAETSLSGLAAAAWTKVRRA